MTAPIRTGLLGLYWGPRADTLDASAERAYRSMELLRSAGYATFHRVGRSRSEAAKKPIAVERAVVHELLARGRSYADIPRKPMVELGWHLSLWSGGRDAEAWSFSIRCGATAAELAFPNAIVLDFPRAGELSLGRSADRACALFDELAEIWSPSSGILQEQAVPATPAPDKPPLRKIG